jgi:hypothetical protein
LVVKGFNEKMVVVVVVVVVTAVEGGTHSV